nr:hypothetical protein CFP56_73656 [Quercus suber]
MLMKCCSVSDSPSTESLLSSRQGLTGTCRGPFDCSALPSISAVTCSEGADCPQATRTADRSNLEREVRRVESAFIESVVASAGQDFYSQFCNPFHMWMTLDMLRPRKFTFVLGCQSWFICQGKSKAGHGIVVEVARESAAARYGWCLCVLESLQHQSVVRNEAEVFECGAFSLPGLRVECGEAGRLHRPRGGIALRAFAHFDADGLCPLGFQPRDYQGLYLSSDHVAV